MSLLKCVDLCVGYEGKVVARNVNFSLDEGDYFCLVGHNGSGKSTLMKTILGLEKPISGRIEFSDGLVQTEIGYLPQQTAFQKDFPASVREIVLSGFLNSLGFSPFYKKWMKDAAMENIRRLGIEDLSDTLFRNLSGGQKQRVLLARALCASKKILLLDEPVNGLDPGATAELYALIADLNRNRHIAILMISHDLQSVSKYATKILDFSQLEEA